MLFTGNSNLFVTVSQPNRNWLDKVARGNDGRVRATYRVLLAYVTFFSIGLIMQFITAVVLELSVTLLTLALVNTLQTLILTTLFYVVWVRQLDRRPLEEYGIDLSIDDAVWFVMAFVATLAGAGIWLGLWIGTGRMSADIVLIYEEGSLLIGILLVSVAIIMGAAIQGIVFIGLMLVNSVAGIQSRVADETVALATGVVVTGSLFVAFHFLLNVGAASFLSPLRAIVTLSAGFLYITGIYLYSGSLLAAIGAHSAVNYSVFFYGLESGADNVPISFPEVLNLMGSPPLTEVFGPLPVPGFVLSFVLLFIIAQTQRS